MELGFPHYSPPHTHTHNIKIQTFIFIHSLGYHYTVPWIVIVYSITVKKKILDRGDEGEEGKQNLPIKQQQTENKGL